MHPGAYTSTTGGGITANTADNSSVIVINGTANTTSSKIASNNFTLSVGTYTIKAYGLNDNGTDRFFISKTDGSGNVVTNIYNETAKTFTLTKDTECRMNFVFANGTSYLDKEVKIQLEVGSIATTYEPYISQTQLISLGDIELAKIGDYTDKLFHAVQGNSIYDSLDSATKASFTVGAWYKQGNIYKMILSARGSLSTTTINNVSAKYGLFTNSSFPMRAVGATKIGEFISDRNVFLSPEDTTFRAYPAYRIANSFVVVTSPNDVVEHFNSKIVGTMLYYVLETPTYTQITDKTLIKQLNNVEKLHTYKNISNIWIEPSETNVMGGLQITYKQDLDTLLDNLDARISLLE